MTDMKAQKNLYEMTERELRSYKRTLKLRRERRRKCLSAVGGVLAAVIMVLVCAFSYGSIDSKANTGYKYYTSVTVEAGETLWQIADDYIDYDYYKNKNSYLSEVCSINHLDNEGSITVGELLILPYYSSEYK
jgi:nucleoid-associated protein YgaU